MTTAFHLENIRRRFGKVQALDGLSLRVGQGEVYGFLGRNGAGKTTTLRILMGIVRADEGTIVTKSVTKTLGGCDQIGFSADLGERKLFVNQWSG
jgi:ABC-type multidrug transport system ATPase subunit